ncbi:replication protein A 70 kDa DNA-binding subunit C-like protein [Tanacetum coccineum]
MEKLPKYLKDSWKLKVRILQLWKQPFQIDMILMDEKVAIKKILIPNFEMLLQEGSIIILSKFSIAENNDIHVFTRNGKESKQISLQLENVEGKKISYTLWDNYAQDFATSVSTGNIEGFVIIIIQFGKVRFWNGNPTVQNALFGTRLFLNEDIEEIISLKGGKFVGDRILMVMFNPSFPSLIVKKGVSTHSQMTTHLASQTVYTLRDEFLTKYPRKYVDDIPDGTEKLIMNLTENEGDNKVFYCNKCKTKVTSVVPRFRVNVRVQDATETISLVLFDREGYQMTDKHAFEIREKQDKDGNVDSFPEDFNKLINKKFIFKIEVSDFNIENGYDVYTVSKVCHDAEIMDAMIKRDAIDKDIVSETEIDQPSIGCLDSKDDVSCTGDSLAATDIDSNSATSPATKRLRDTSDKDILVCFQETSNTSSEVGIGVSSSCHDSLSNANNCTPNTKRGRQDYFDNGDPTSICHRCGAMLWHAKTLIGNQNVCNNAYSLCCGKGKVQLPKCPDPPHLLSNLYRSKHPKILYVKSNCSNDEAVDPPSNHDIKNSAGPDRVTVAVYEGNNDESMHGIEANVDEIKEYPSVERLSFHLPGEQNIVYEDDDDLCDFPMSYVWNISRREWTPRKQRMCIGRIHYVPISTGDSYYLRVLLNKVRWPTSHEDICTVNGITILYPSYKEACHALGLLDDDKEYVEAIEEASKWATAASLYLQLQPEVVKNITLFEIEQLLCINGSTLRNIDGMPYPDDQYVLSSTNRLIHDELSYDKDLLKVEHVKLLKSLTDE